MFRKRMKKKTVGIHRCSTKGSCLAPVTGSKDTLRNLFSEERIMLALLCCQGYHFSFSKQKNFCFVYSSLVLVLCRSPRFWFYTLKSWIFQ